MGVACSVTSVLFAAGALFLLGWGIDTLVESHRKGGDFGQVFDWLYGVVAIGLAWLCAWVSFLLWVVPRQ